MDAWHAGDVRTAILIGVLVISLVAGATIYVRTERSEAQDLVVVGTGPESEARLVAEILVALLEGAGVPAQVQPYESSRAARGALELGSVDALPSYTGSVWLEVLRRPELEGDPAESYEVVRRADIRRDLIWLPPTQVNATFTFVVPDSGATARLVDMSDLAGFLERNPEARLCADRDFARRPDGLTAVAETYAMREVDVIEAPADVTVEAVLRGDCVAGLTSATDPALAARDVKALDDDRRVFPAFVLAVVVTNELREREDGAAVAALTAFDGRVTNQLLAEWNARVFVPEPLETVARDAAVFLTAPPPSPAG